MAVLALATVPGTLGIPKLVTREVAAAEARKDVGALFGVLRWADRTIWRISAAIAALVAMAALLAHWRGSAPLATAILVGAPLILLQPLAGVRGGALRGLRYIVLGQLANVLLRPLAVSILLFAAFTLGSGVEPAGAMALHSLSAAGALLLTHFWLKRRLPRGVAARPVEDGRKWLASSIPMAMTDAMRTMQLQLAVLVLGVLASPTQVGLFRVSTALMIVVFIPWTVVNLVVLPLYSKLHVEGDYAKLQRLVTVSGGMQFVGVLLLALPCLFAAGPLLDLVFGSSYAAAADTLRILALGQVIAAGFGSNGVLLTMTGHERRVTRATSISFVVTLALAVLLGSQWGSVGTAIGVLVGQVCWQFLLSRDCIQQLNIQTSVLRFVWRRGRAWR
jgi:O-antigen/teichoic acid export membrane protein